MKVTDVTIEQLNATVLRVTHTPEDGRITGDFAAEVVANSLGVKIAAVFSVLDPEVAPLLCLAAGIRLGLALAESAVPATENQEVAA